MDYYFNHNYKCIAFIADFNPCALIRSKCILLMALVMLFIGFFQTFIDAGVSNAIIHKQNINKSQLDTLYFVNIESGFSIFLVVCLLAPLFANIYSEPQLTSLIVITGIILIIQPIGQQFLVLLQKDMRFNEIAKIEISTKQISVLFTIFFAYAEYGVYSLVTGTLTSVMFQMFLLVKVGIKLNKPSLQINFSEVRDFLNFGFYQIGERSINYFAGQADIFIIGKLLNVETLGVYTIIKQIFEKNVYLINSVVNKMAFPLFSKI